jgi:hypothetical protein
MATYAEVSTSLDDYRLALFDDQQNEDFRTAAAAFSAQGASSAFATPLNNVHATGLGVRIRRGKVFGSEFVIKIFVFEKMNLGLNTPKITGQDFQGIGIDVEHLPIQMALAKKKAKSSKTRVKRKPSRKKKSSATKSALAATTPAQHQARRRPVIGGLQISPFGASFVGTLGGLVRRGSQLFALSNNHVIADTNQLPIGTDIVQSFGVNLADVFARLSDFEPIRFPSPGGGTPRNRIDAGIAAVTSAGLVQTGTMFGIPNYTAQAATPIPGTGVTKSGRTTAVTTGTITATRVNGVRVNYGTLFSPIIATFDNCVEVTGNFGPFSDSGDSGSFILESNTGRPVSLLFAGDGSTTTGCDFGEVLTRFNVVPA